MYRYLSFIIITVLLSACGNKTTNDTGVPPEVIQPEQMIQIIVDFYIAEAALVEVQQKQLDVHMYARRYYGAILKKHGVSREEVYESFDYYGRNLKLTQAVMEEVVTELSMKQSMPALPVKP